jgi:hypothetical protein
MSSLGAAGCGYLYSLYACGRPESGRSASDVAHVALFVRGLGWWIATLEGWTFAVLVASARGDLRRTHPEKALSTLAQIAALMMIVTFFLDAAIGLPGHRGG